MGANQSNIQEKINYNCPVCKETGKVPNIAGRFHIISSTECQCSGCNTIFEKKKYYKPGDDVNIVKNDVVVDNPPFTDGKNDSIELTLSQRFSCLCATSVDINENEMNLSIHGVPGLHPDKVEKLVLSEEKEVVQEKVEQLSLVEPTVSETMER